MMKKLFLDYGIYAIIGLALGLLVVFTTDIENLRVVNTNTHEIVEIVEPVEREVLDVFFYVEDNVVIKETKIDTVKYFLTEDGQVEYVELYLAGILVYTGPLR